MIPIRWLVLRDGFQKELLRIPTTESVSRRPVYERYLCRKHHLPLKPPTEDEKRDAIVILADPWVDEISEEAFRILDEAPENGTS